MNRKSFFLIGFISLILTSCGHANGNKTQRLTDSILSIGTRQYSWEDTSRLDDYYGGTRKVNVQVWYPSEELSPESSRTPYLLFNEELYNKIDGWNESDFKAVQKIKTNSAINAAIDKDLNKAPLLIFSPSLGGNLSYYTYYAEYFAKQGYIVMGLNHLYESEVIVHSNMVYQQNERFHDSLKSLKIPEEISAEKYREAMGLRQKILGQDIQFTLNQLLTNTIFGDRIDSSKVAVFGHSIGGAAAIYSAILDNRIKAVINMDGTPPTVALNNGIDVPYLFLEDLTDYRNHQGYAMQFKRRSDFCDLNHADSWRVLIKGFSHNSFLDVNYFLAENVKEANAEKANLDLILGYMNTFLNHYLLDGKAQNLTPTETEDVEVIPFIK